MVETGFGGNSFPSATTILFMEMPAVKNITLQEGSLGKTEEIVISSMFCHHYHYHHSNYHNIVFSNYS